MDFITPQQAALLPIQHLAWIGDAIYELYSRQNIVLSQQMPPGQAAHRASATLTSASGQAQSLKKIQDMLTDQERDLVRRGRNTKGLPRSTPEYCQATGLEVVVGWLWLSEQHQRLEEILVTILPGGDTCEG